MTIIGYSVLVGDQYVAEFFDYSDYFLVDNKVLAEVFNDKTFASDLAKQLNGKVLLALSSPSPVSGNPITRFVELD